MDLDRDGEHDGTMFDFDGDGMTDAVDIAGRTLTIDESGQVVDEQVDGPGSAGQLTQRSPFSPIRRRR